MAQNILSAGDLECFPNQGKVERGHWVGSSVEENRGLSELSSAAKFIGGRHQALHANDDMTFHLLSEWRSHVAYSEGKLRTIFIDYCFYALKGQNVLWFPLAQMW